MSLALLAGWLGVCALTNARGGAVIVVKGGWCPGRIIGKRTGKLIPSQIQLSLEEASSKRRDGSDQLIVLKSQEINIRIGQIV